jgi:uncharacterized protein (TIGR02452 family)
VNQLRDIADETMRIISSGGYQTTAGASVQLAETIALAVAGTRLYHPNDPLPTGAERVIGTPLITVTPQTSLAAALHADGDVACLVFASAKRPGGGFRTGAVAQEESLARASALVACQESAPGFYMSNHDPRYSDRVIYSPGVPVFRDDAGRLLDQPRLVTFLTAAAPNLGAIERNQPELAARVPRILRARAARVLDIAAAHGHSQVVLGAWGCGVFGNDPAVVARAFADILRGDRRFTRIVFAIHDTRPGVPARAAFTRVFHLTTLYLVSRSGEAHPRRRLGMISA